MLEERGLPKVDQLMGGRYVPAVRAFFDRLYGLDTANVPLAPMASRTLTDGKHDQGHRPDVAQRQDRSGAVACCNESRVQTGMGQSRRTSPTTGPHSLRVAIA